MQSVRGAEIKAECLTRPLPPLQFSVAGNTAKRILKHAAKDTRYIVLRIEH